MKELILGGARSGKSALATSRASDSGLAVIVIATATAGDAEMAARIVHHQQTRPESWQTVEEPIDLAGALQRHADTRHCLLVDCLTLWLSNLFHHCDGNELISSEIDRLIDLLPRLTANLILVSNEIGQGLVPVGVDNRLFIDETGRLHQRLAQVCDRVTLTVAGLPMTLKAPA